MMDPLEGQAKAIVAAALIVRGAVEVPAIPTGTQRVPDAGGMRLRELTDFKKTGLLRILPGDRFAFGSLVESKRREHAGRQQLGHAT
jgi:hypothetical protein